MPPACTGCDTERAPDPFESEVLHPHSESDNPVNISFLVLKVENQSTGEMMGFGSRKNGSEFTCADLLWAVGKVTYHL